MAIQIIGSHTMRPINVMTLRLIYLIVLSGCCGIAASAPTDKTRQIEISAIDFEGLWSSTSDPSFPKEAVRAFPKYAKEELAKVSLQFVWVNLDGNGENEIIVASQWASGSGGTSYFVLRKVVKAWHLIAEFQGGLVLSMRDSPSAFYRIISYYRAGDTWQHTYDYRDGKYRLISEVMIPSVISRNCWWNSLLGRLNSSGFYNARSQKCDGRDGLGKRSP